MTHRLLPLLTLTAALAACSQAPQTPQATPASGAALTALTLNAPLRGALTRQGLPSLDGASLVETVTVKIKDANGTLMTFDGQNVYRAGGPQDSVVLTNTASSAQVLLPAGTYTFESVGKAGTGDFLAYGKSAPQALSSSQSVTLGLHTLIDPSAVELAFAASSVQPGGVLDVRLTVPTHDVNGARADVPTSDYSVSYGIQGGSVVTQSKLGTRVQNATAAPGGIGVSAHVEGWIADGPDTAALTTIDVGDSVPVATTLTAGLHEENDAAIQYSGEWTAVSDSSFSGQSAMSADAPDGSVFFAFQGSGLTAHLGRSPGGSFDVYLDDELVASYDGAIDSTTSQSETYVLDDLDPKESHTVNFVCTAPHCVFDSVEVR